MDGLREERGAILGLAVALAVLAGISAYFVLQLSVHSARQGTFYRDRAAARNAAEVGLVWAYQRLWSTPAYCGVPDPPPMDHDGIAATPPIAVDVTVTNCGAGNNHTLTAKVTY